MQANTTSLLSILGSMAQQPSIDGGWSESSLTPNPLGESFVSELNRLRATANPLQEQQELPPALLEQLPESVTAALLEQAPSELDSQQLSSLLAQISLGQQPIPYTPIRPAEMSAIESDADELELSDEDALLLALADGAPTVQSTSLSNAQTVVLPAEQNEANSSTHSTANAEIIPEHPLAAQAEAAALAANRNAVGEQSAVQASAQSPELLNAARNSVKNDGQNPLTTAESELEGFKPNEVVQGHTGAQPSAVVSLETAESGNSSPQTSVSATVAAFNSGQAFANSTAQNTQGSVVAAQGSEFARQLETQMQAEQEFSQDQRQWGNTLGSRILTMISEDVQQARIHLDPPELGTLEIKLQLQQQQASIQVHTQHAQVRDALEAHAFRLREALAEQGIQMTEFDVSSGQQFAEQQQEQQANEQVPEQNNLGEGASGVAGIGESTEQAEPVIMRSSHNLLDTYA